MPDSLSDAEKLAIIEGVGFQPEPEPAEPPPPGDENAPEKTKPPAESQATLILQLTDAAGEKFFHDELETPYAIVPMPTHNEVMELQSQRYKHRLAQLYRSNTGKAVGADAIAQAVLSFSGTAIFEGERIPLSVRVAERDGEFWYDLSNEHRQAVCITGKTWHVVSLPPIMFRSFTHQAPQVMPRSGGDIRKILKYVNVKTGTETLFLCWLVTLFIPDIPHPLLALYGEKGAAKTTASEFIKLLADPSVLETLSFPNDERGLVVNLSKHHFLSFDNVSYLSQQTSDVLCRAITGGGQQQRTLYTNAEDTVFKFKRAIAINGINCVAKASDLLDRSILLEVERISETDRREIAQIKAEFEADRAEILGGIFDTLCAAMSIHPDVKLDRLPRMADFTRWGYAISEVLEGGGQVFIDQYADNRAIQNEEAISADPVATLIVEFMKGLNEWEGTASQLYKELVNIADDHNINTRSKSFPPDTTRLSKRINAVKSNLEQVGIMYHRGKSGNRYTTLKWVDSSARSVLASETPKLGAFSPDARESVASYSDAVASEPSFFDIIDDPDNPFADAREVSADAR